MILFAGCKRGASGKLFAMKVMNKRRIKIRQSEDLCWNERRILEALGSPFVVSCNIMPVSFREARLNHGGHVYCIIYMTLATLAARRLTGGVRWRCGSQVEFRNLVCQKQRKTKQNKAPELS